MPSGRTHDRITFWCLPLVIGVTLWVTRSPAIAAIVSITHLIGGLMLGPDLDIHSNQYKRWGPLRWIWLPYQIALPHRSHLSHGPLIGTALRVIYLSFWLSLFIVGSVEVISAIWKIELSFPGFQATYKTVFERYLSEWIAILVGLEIGAMSHSASDVIGSRLNRKKRRKKRRK